MAIDRGPWNALVDDDGSNLVGSIWNKAAIKTVILDPTDAALVAAAPIYGTWTPIDASGAGLAFSNPVGTYTKVGRLVFISIGLTYPATSNGAVAIVGGLPFANGGMAGGLTTCYGIHRVIYMPASGTTFYFYNAATVGQYTNANMSGAAMNLSGCYQAAS